MTKLVSEAAELFRISGYKVHVSVNINYREIDIVAEETQGLVRKTVLVECADYASSVGPDKLDTDLQKLLMAKEKLGHKAVLMHVARTGYTPQALGFAQEHGLDVYTIHDLAARLINFQPYLEAIEAEPIRQVIMREYQSTSLHFEGRKTEAKPAIEIIDKWLETDQRWLTILGDYGVGKSWLLKRLLYHLADKYREDPAANPLPFFVPLQQFTKAFSYANLILATFQRYGLAGAHYEAFQYLAGTGRIAFLFDSFDEMAQFLRPDIVRQNLSELLSSISGNSKAIMTSRPNYFESRAERLLIEEQNGESTLHPLDKGDIIRQTHVSRFIESHLTSSRFARLNDLTESQRKKLFSIVLRDKPKAFRRLTELFERFRDLENISQRAVIARLLTTVAETLAQEDDPQTPEGERLIPEDLDKLNQARIFSIVVHNLLSRDQQIGLLSAADRLFFLRSFAVYLQRPGSDHFAGPDEIREIVRYIFEPYLRRTDTPHQLLENYYRACRRHSGLTTEGQFLDRAGNIDSPVDERDTESRVGFSHNSLREFLVADALHDLLLRDTVYQHIQNAVVTETVGGFFGELAEYHPELVQRVADQYSQSIGRFREVMFKLIYFLVRGSSASYIRLLGDPPIISQIDISALDFSALDLSGARIEHCLAADTDFRSSNLRDAFFEGTVIEAALFDGAVLRDCDMTGADLISIYVFDQFVRETSAVLPRKEALQWVFASGAKVAPNVDLNPFLGQPWYEAAREVTRTLERRIAGTHNDGGLVKGVSAKYRSFAAEFVEFLLKAKILRRVKKAGKDKAGEWVVGVASEHRTTIHEFSVNGRVDDALKPFFSKHLSRR